jgi:tetratricopeptide (TPR) repeat protein
MVEEAQLLINDADRRYPDSTFVHTVLLPTTRAAIALFRGRAAEAIAALRNATPTELGTVAGLVPFYLRGEAHLMKREYSEAIRQYESILRHRGVDPLSPVVPLAHLGIARAQARSGDRDAARRAYEALFAMWKSADPDFPPLVAARAEYAALK